jgi:vancomycin resistance protein VanJ
MDSASSRSIQNPVTKRRANRAVARQWPRLGRTIQIFCWLYLAALLLLCLFLRREGDRWWPATLILFGPRWIWALPMGILAPLVLLLHRRSLWVLGCAGVVIVGPVMGLCIGFGTAGPTTALHLRVLTCNTHEGQLDVEAMKQLIADTQPDIVALQECYPWRASPVFDASGWNIASDGEFTLGSRFPIRAVRVSFDRHAAQSRGAAVVYEVQARGTTLRFFSIHLTSPHSPFRSALHLQRFGGARVEINSATRNSEAQDVAAQAEGFAGPVLLAGDFNLPADSSIFRDNFAAFTDAFASAGFGFGWTYFEKWTVARIDHILAGPGWTCQRCWVAPSVGSDHHPLLADLEWTPTAGR